MKTLFKAYKKSTLDIMVPRNCHLCGTKIFDRLWKEKPVHEKCKTALGSYQYMTAREIVMEVSREANLQRLKDLYVIEMHQDARMTVLRAIDKRISKLLQAQNNKQINEKGFPKKNYKKLQS